MKNSLTHIAFIMDGNGRWAEKRGKKRSDGHAEGVEAIKRIIKACVDKKIPIVSIFAFSTENWKRPKDEIDAIFSLIEKLNRDYIKKEEKQVGFNFFGNIAELPESVRKSIEEVKEKTKKNRTTILNVMINYGGRAEIVMAVNKLIEKNKKITEENIKKNLYTGYLKEPDIIVRTAGEQRLSNFMIYQCAYSELFFIEKYWPDMQEEDLDMIIKEFETRKRRYGGI